MITLDGASNFRDLGGLRNRQGQYVRQGHVFRSDHLANLTDRDRNTIEQLGLTHSLDLRGVREHAAQRYEIVGVRHVPLPIEPTVIYRVEAMLKSGQMPSASDAVELMCETYRGFVTHSGPVFGALLRHLIEHPTPQVFHCTAGKDRTGMAAALFLSALDVDQDTIMADYLRTNELYRRDPAWAGHAPEHLMAVLWQVQPAFLFSAFDVINTEFGGMDAYLAGPVGLTPSRREAFQARFLA